MDIRTDGGQTIFDGDPLHSTQPGTTDSAVRADGWRPITAPTGTPAAGRLRIGFTAVFVLAVLLRGAWLILMYQQADDRRLLLQTPDSWRYVQIGTHYAGLPYTGPPPAVHSGPVYGTPEGSILWSGPGYGLFLAGLFSLLGTAAWPVLAAQVVLSGVCCVLIGVLAIELQLSRRVAVIAGAISAVSLTSISLSCVVLSETLFFVLFLGGLCCVARGVRWNEFRWFAAAGLLCGAATLVRGITVFWPAVLVALALLAPHVAFAGSRFRLLRNAVGGAALMSVIIGGWTARNYVRHGVLTFAETGVFAARYYWTARTLAGLDPTRNTRAVQHDMEAQNLARYGRRGTTFAQHHRDDVAVVIDAFKRHPVPMIKRFAISMFQNMVRGSTLHTRQLPQFKELWLRLKPLVHRKSGMVIAALAALGTLMLLSSPHQRWAAMFLLVAYAYVVGISGFEFWQGSRICHPAQAAWAILLAVVLDRVLGTRRSGRIGQAA